MLVQGINKINNIITEDERLFMSKEIQKSFNSSNLSIENYNNHYKNSYGGEVIFNDIYDRLTKEISLLTGLKLKKANSYSRIYFNDSILKPHLDREGLDLTLSIQIDNRFENIIPIYARSYDNKINKVELNNGDGLLIKGRELEHWRDTILGKGYLTCVFFHWEIEELEYEEIKDFIPDTECDNILKQVQFSKFVNSSVLHDYNSVIDTNSRSSKSLNYKSTYLDLSLSKYFGDLKLEGWQLLKYEKGDKFTAHYDNGNSIDNRLFTVLLYLNDDYEGGETYFNNLDLEIKPKKGKLLIFKNLKNNKNNTYSLHTGKEILNNTKYVLVNWILK